MIDSRHLAEAVALVFPDEISCDEPLDDTVARLLLYFKGLERALENYMRDDSCNMPLDEATEHRHGQRVECPCCYCQAKRAVNSPLLKRNLHA